MQQLTGLLIAFIPKHSKFPKYIPTLSWTSSYLGMVMAFGTEEQQWWTQAWIYRALFIQPKKTLENTRDFQNYLFVRISIYLEKESFVSYMSFLK